MKRCREKKVKFRLIPGHDCSLDIATPYPPCRKGEEAEGRVGWGLLIEPYVVETGEGSGAPLPVSPSPGGDTPTVQCTGRQGRRTGYGCPPGIATTAPAPEGAGEERRRRGRGGGY